MNKMNEAYNWGRNWATMKAAPDTHGLYTSEYVANSMMRNFSFEKWLVKYRDEFWHGFNAGPHISGDSVSIHAQPYDFYT